MRRSWAEWSEILIEIGVTVVVALVLTRIIVVASRRFAKRILVAEEPPTMLQRRAQTIASVLRSGLLIALWAAAGILALSTAGVAVGPVLAAAGIVGLALGLGAQNVVKDVLGGFMIVLEYQYDVGDVITVMEVTGSVEAVNLRTTVLRGEDGARHVVPNGEIRLSTNLTRTYSRHLITLRVPVGQYVDVTIAVARRVSGQMRMDDPYRRMMTRPLKVMGVDDISAEGVTVTAYVETVPGEQWAVGRELRRRIAAALADEGLALG